MVVTEADGGQRCESKVRHDDRDFCRLHILYCEVVLKIPLIALERMIDIFKIQVRQVLLRAAKNVPE